MNQRYLTFPEDSPRARVTDHKTSHDAAEEVAPKLGFLHRTFLDVLEFFGPLTAREVEREAANLHRNTFLPDSVRKRAAELVKRGLIREAGVRVCSVSGQKATVYSLTERTV